MAPVNTLILLLLVFRAVFNGRKTKTKPITSQLDYSANLKPE